MPALPLPSADPCCPQIRDDQESKCFVCNLDSSTFERQRGGGFRLHTEQEHHLWDYLFFFVSATLG